MSYDDVIKKFSKEDGNIYLYDLRSSRGLNNQYRLSAEEAKMAILKNNDLELSLEHKIDPVEIDKYFLAKDLREFNKSEALRKTKFDDPLYTEPGGEDYKELIFKLKGDGSYPIEKQIQNSTSSGTEPLKDFKMKTSFPYTSPRVHFGIKNEFANVRFKTRFLDKDKNNKKVLTVEEMLSDIVQDMKTSFGERVTDFPFKNTWYEVVSKRLIRYAADNGFDAVAIPKGQTIATRYRQKIDNITEVNLEPRIGPSGNDLRFVVTYFGGGNRELRRQTLYNNEILELQKELGPKNYLKIKDQIDEAIKNIKSKGDIKKDLIIGKFDKPVTIGSGKGKADLYDKAIPSFLKKYSKKWNAEVYDYRLSNPENSSIPVTILEITPSMKKSVQEEGQSLFEILGIGTGAAIAAESISDSKGNNTISNLTQ